jgi:GGDEF domain-containing protein
MRERRRQTGRSQGGYKCMGHVVLSASLRSLNGRLLAFFLIAPLCVLATVRAASWLEPLRVWPQRDVAAQYWADDSGRATLQQAQAQFAAGQGRPVIHDEVMPIGWGRAVWYQLQLPHVPQPARAVLSVPFSGIDRLDFYRPDGEGGWQSQASGDAIPVEQWPVRFVHPAFAFTLQPGEAAATYLRVQHSHDTGMSWTLWDAGTFAEVSKRSYLLVGTVAGFAGLVFLISLFNAVSWRDPLHLYYAVHVGLIALTIASLNGVAGELLWPANAWLNDIASVVLPALTVAWLALFVRALVDERGMRAVSWLLLGVCLAGSGAAAALLLFGRPQARAGHVALHVYILVALLCSVAVTAWYAWRQRQPGSGWIVVGLCMLLTGSLFTILRNFGVLPLSVATQYGPSAGWIVEIPLVLAGLYFRSRTRRDHRLRMQSLAHTDPLTGAASHPVMLSRIRLLLRSAAADPGVGAVMRVRVGNLDTIRAEHGREAAEAALMQAAECLSKEAGLQDTLGREKGGDLVLVLTGRMTRTQAAEAGRNVIARGLKYSTRLPPLVTLNLQVAVMAAPLPALAAQELLAVLGERLDEMGRIPSARSVRVLTAGEPDAGPVSVAPLAAAAAAGKP